MMCAQTFPAARYTVKFSRVFESHFCCHGFSCAITGWLAPPPTHNNKIYWRNKRFIWFLRSCTVFIGPSTIKNTKSEIWWRQCLVFWYFNQNNFLSEISCIWLRHGFQVHVTGSPIIHALVKGTSRLHASEKFRRHVRSPPFTSLYIVMIPLLQKPFFQWDSDYPSKWKRL